MKHGSTLAFMAVGVLIGLLVTWQLQTELPAGGSFVTDEVTAREDLFTEFLNEQAYLQSRVIALRGEIAEAQEEVDLVSSEFNLEMLNSLKEKVGLTEVVGPGLEISLDDSPLVQRTGENVSDKQLVQASDLRDIVNVLNASSAEAVSINGQRVIATTAITSVGATLLVNNSYVVPPFDIKAVGDSELMLQRLLNESLLPELYERSRSSGLVFRVGVANQLAVPIYNADLKTDYINLVE